MLNAIKLPPTIGFYLHVLDDDREPDFIFCGTKASQVIEIMIHYDNVLGVFKIDVEGQIFVWHNRDEFLNALGMYYPDFSNEMRLKSIGSKNDEVVIEAVYWSGITKASISSNLSLFTVYVKLDEETGEPYEYSVLKEDEEE